MARRKPRTGKERVALAKNAPTTPKWWCIEAEDLPTALSARATTLWDRDEDRRQENEKNLKRWGITLSGLYLDPTQHVHDSMRLNITKSLTETITAKIGENRPRPLVLTDGGRWENKQRAKKLQRFLDGVYQQTDAYALFGQVFRNAMLMDGGVLHVSGQPGLQRFELENVFPLEILVDSTMAARGPKHVRELLRVYPADKDALMDAYDHKPADVLAAIDGAPMVDLGDGSASMPSWLDGMSSRSCQVTEAWYLAGHDREGTVIPGRHVKMVGSTILEDEEWLEDRFPFLFHFWSAPVRGFWGMSAVAEIRGLEREANVNLQRAQEANRRGGMPLMLVPSTANVKPEAITNEPFPIVKYDGQVPPAVTLLPVAHPQLMEQPERLMNLAANQLGTNQMQTAAERPPGTESGRMLEQLSEEHIARFKSVSKAFEGLMSKDLACAFVAQAKRMDRARRDMGLKEGLRLRSTYKREVIDLKWDQVELGPGEFFIDVWPVSVLPHTPSGRTAEVERWQGNKWLTPAQAKMLLDFPDLESEASVERADQELLEWQLGKMLDDGEAQVPDQRQDLKNALAFGTHALLKARRENVPEEHVRYLEDFLAIIEEWTAPPPAPAMPPPSEAQMGAVMPDAGMMGAPPAPEMAGPGLGATPGVTAPQVSIGPGM